MTPEQLETERQLFDRYASDNGAWPQAVQRNGNGAYILMATSCDWRTWLARAELEYTKQKVPA